MSGHPVGTLVNKSVNDDERCVERVESETPVQVANFCRVRLPMFA